MAYKELHEQYDLQSILVDANSILKGLNKRIYATRVIHISNSFVSNITFRLNNSKAMVIVLENDKVKSVLLQVRKNKSYYYLVNGQESTNTECIYFNNHMQEDRFKIDLDKYNLENNPITYVDDVVLQSEAV